MKFKSKKLLAILLSLTMLITAMPFAVSAAESSEVEIAAQSDDNEVGATSGTIGQVYWKTEGKVLTIYGDGYVPHLQSEDEVPWRKDITKVIIEDGIDYIGNNVFYYCPNITAFWAAPSINTCTITAFNSKTRGQILFHVAKGGKMEKYCQDLNLNYEYSYGTVGDLIFTVTEVNSDKLLTISGDGVIPDFTSAQNYPWPKDATKLWFEGNITEVGDYAFYGCSNLSYNSYKGLPKTIHRIGRDAFKGTHILGSWYLLNDPYPTLEHHDDVMFNFKDTFTDTEFALKESRPMDGIIDYAFTDSNSANVEVIDLRAGVRFIGKHTFTGATNLKRIYLPNNLEYIGEGAFAGLTNLTICGYEGSLAQTYAQENNIPFIVSNGASGDCSFELKGTILTIRGSGAMADYSPENPSEWPKDITRVYIENGVTSIGDYAFDGCTELSKIFIADSVTSVAEHTFNGVNLDQTEGLSFFVYDPSYTKTYCEENNYRYYPLNGMTGDCFWRIEGSVMTISGTGYMGNHYYDNHAAQPWYDSRLDIYTLIIEDGVKSIGNCAFHEFENITEVTIPGSVEEIGYEAFEYCYNLKTVNLSEGLKYLRVYAFDWCYRLENIVLPESLIEIDRDAFYQCQALTSINEPGNLQYVDNRAFEFSGIERSQNESVAYLGDIALCYPSDNYYYMPSSIRIKDGTKYIAEQFLGDGYYSPTRYNNLRSVFIPEGVERLGRSSFWCCRNLQEVYIPESVTQIGDYSFGGCPDSLTIYTYEGSAAQAYAEANNINCVILNGKTGNCDWRIYDGVLTISGEGTLGDTPWKSEPYKSRFSKVVIEKGVKNISSYAFNNLEGIKEVTINADLDIIDTRAFGGCVGITSITITGKVKVVGNYAFESVRRITEISFPDGLEYIDYHAFQNCKLLATINIPDSVEWIGGGAFDTGDEITDTQWYKNQPDGLVYLGKVAYKYKGTCPSRIVLRDDTVAIACACFENCSNLTEIVLPEGLKGINRTALENTSISSITLPDSLTRLGQFALANTKLTDVYIPDGVQMDGYVFVGCSDLKSVRLPEGLTAIPYDTFVNCTSLKSVTIPDTVETINSQAFSGCTSLKEFEIPGTVKTIKDKAFYNCTGLEKLIIPRTVTEFAGDDIFTGCENLTIYCYNKSAAHIYAKEHNIPFIVTDGESGSVDFVLDGTTLIISGSGPMEDYSPEEPSPWPRNITKVIVKDGVTSIGDYAFDGCTELKDIIIYESVTEIGEHVFNGCDLEDDGLLMYVYDPSYAKTFAADNGYNYRCLSGTTGECRFRVDNDVLTISGNGRMADHDTYNTITENVSPWAELGKFFSKVVVEDGVTYVGKSSFAYMDNITEVRIAGSVKELPAKAILTNPNLTKVYLADGVEEISSYCFYYCPNITELRFPDSLTRVLSPGFQETAWFNNHPDGVVYAGKTALGYKGEIPETIEIKEGTKAVAGRFLNISNTNLVNLYLPDSLEFVGSGAFTYCKGLENIRFPSGVVEYYADVYAGISEYYNIFGCSKWYQNQPDGVVYAGKVAYTYKGELPETVYLREDTVAVNRYCFADNDDIRNVVLNDRISMIGQYAFRNCYNLETVNLPRRLRSIEQYAFYSCGKLTSLELPEGLVKLGYQFMASCNSITDITIPSTVREMSPYAFYCDKLETLIIRDGIEVIPERAFFDNKFQEVVIPDSVKRIEIDAFSACDNLTKIVIPRSVTELPEKDMLWHSYNVTIYGYRGSEAEAYATRNHVPFVAIEEPTEEPTTEEPTTEEPTTEEPTTEEPTTEEPTTEEPATEESTTEEPTTEEPTKNILVGDVNFDGIVSVADATLVQKCAAELVEFNDDQNIAGDCSGDGIVSVADATLIQKYAAEFTEDLKLTGTYVTVGETPTEEPIADEPTTEEPTTEPVGTRKVRFSNNQYWSNVYIYYYGGADQIQFPGVKLSTIGTNIYGEKMYDFDLPNDVTAFVFSDGISDQTIDIPNEDKSMNGYYPTSRSSVSNHWNVGTYYSDDIK